MVSTISATQPLRVYIDTSVFGGYYDDEFSVASRQFFDAVFMGQLIPLVSETLVAELMRAPVHVQDLLDKTIQARSERLVLTSEAIALRDAYLRSEVVTQKYADDALHVAQATLARADVTHYPTRTGILRYARNDSISDRPVGRRVTPTVSWREACFAT